MIGLFNFRRKNCPCIIAKIQYLAKLSSDLLRGSARGLP